MVEKLTAALVSTAGEPMRPATWVTIEEVAGGAWGIGGNAMHTGDVLGVRSGARRGSSAYRGRTPIGTAAGE